MEDAESVPNFLADRYATAAMRSIWTWKSKILLERELWIAVLRAQRDLGGKIPDGVIESYERVKDEIDLSSIGKRESASRHDVKARIEEFCHLAGQQYIHIGMTGRDSAENVEQMQVLRALQEIRSKTVAVLVSFSKRAKGLRDCPIVGRTHNVPAQLTTMGKRLAMFGDELLYAYTTLEKLIEGYPARGLKGAVGTRLDQTLFFNGDRERARMVDRSVVEHMGMNSAWNSVGQIYPRSLDLHVVSTLCEIGSGPSSFARTIRLMAGVGIADEGMTDGQIGSSAMPHKVNCSACERINGLHAVLKGFLAMGAALAGDQWCEGDVSCSVVRRIMLPQAFMALDGVLETTLAVLSGLRFNRPSSEMEIERFLPFLLTTTVLTEAVKSGVGRESAHAAIRDHAISVLAKLVEGKQERNDLLDRLAEDQRLGLSQEQIAQIAAAGAKEVGDAAFQVDQFCAQVDSIALAHPVAAAYRAGKIA